MGKSLLGGSSQGVCYLACYTLSLSTYLGLGAKRLGPPHVCQLVCVGHDRLCAREPVLRSSGVRTDNTDSCIVVEAGI